MKLVWDVPRLINFLLRLHWKRINMTWMFYRLYIYSFISYFIINKKKFKIHIFASLVLDASEKEIDKYLTNKWLTNTFVQKFGALNAALPD